MPVKRRTLVIGSVFAGGAAVMGGLAWSREGEEATVEPPETTSSTWSALPLVNELLASSREDVLRVALDAVRSGTSRDQLLEAGYLLPIVSGGDRGDVHSMLVIPSIGHLADQANDTDAWMQTLWAIDNAHFWSKAGQWEPANLSVAAVEDPEQALAEAIRDQDPDRASEATTSGLSTLGVPAMAAFLRAHAASRVSDPHLAIHAAQATRALDRFGNANADVILAALARHIARTTGAEIPRAEPTMVQVNSDPRALAETLKAAPNMLLLGTDPDAVWNALAMLASDSRLAAREDASGPAVHDTTLLDALLYCYLASDSAQGKARLLQHSAYWIASLTARYPATAHAITPSGIGLSERRARIAERGTEPHDFKYQHAVESIRSHLSDTVATHFTDAASVAPVLNSEARWERREEALELIREM